MCLRYGICGMANSKNWIYVNLVLVIVTKWPVNKLEKTKLECAVHARDGFVVTLDIFRYWI